MVLRALILFCASAISSHDAAEEFTPESSGSSLRRRLIEDAADGSFDQFTLWQAATIAGGGGPRQLSELSVEFDKLLERAKQVDDRQALTRRRAQRLFELMHGEVFTSEYQSDLNDFAESFTSGRFNCVTATLLYQGLCRACGLSPCAVAAPAHVYTRVKSERVLNIETTCPEWFRLGKGQAKPSPPGRELTDVQLVGKIFYNRGVHLLGEQRFADAIEQLETSLLFDPHDQTAKDNRLAALNNWALHRSQAGRHAAAAALLRQGMELRANYPPFLANDLHIHQKWAQHLCREGDFSRALQLFHERHLARPDAPLFDEGRVSIYRHWLSAVISGEPDAADRAELLAGRELLADHAELDDWTDARIRRAIKELRDRTRDRRADHLADWARSLRPVSSQPSAALDVASDLTE